MALAMAMALEINPNIKFDDDMYRKRPFSIHINKNM